MSIDRITYLEYLTQTISIPIGFVFRSPPISYVSNIYYLPFTGIVWLCSIALVILCTFITSLTIVFRFSSDDDIKNMNTSDYFLFAIASVCQMGTEVFTKVLSTRISMVSLQTNNHIVNKIELNRLLQVSYLIEMSFSHLWFQFAFFVALLFIYTSFTANIVALLQSTTKSIQTIKDLQNPAIEIGVQDTPYNRHYFGIQTEPTRKQLYETKVAPPNEPDAFMNVSHGVSRIRQGMFAFHVSSSAAYDEIERTFFENEKCGLVEINYLGKVDTWTVIPKQSPYKEILKVK